MKRALIRLSVLIIYVIICFSAALSAAADIPKDSWRLKSVDSEELVGENGAAENAFDGNVNTIWHTAWLATNPPQPHEIQIDLGVAYAINGFRYLPRQDGGANGMIGQYEFYVSDDGSNWGNAVATGTFANNASEKEVTFQPAVGRYIRLRSVSEVNGNPWTSMAEISVLGATPSGNQPPDGVINSPSASMTINVGDLVQFSGTGSDLDNDLPLSYLWQFGAGSGVLSSNLEDPGLMQFNTPGSFTVTFTVTDALNLSDPTPATRIITVRSQSSTIPKDSWRLKSVDCEELVGENGAAENAFDGNVNTMWHTAWLASNPPQPHEIQIDLGLAYAINGFRYLPRQDGGANGRIGQYEFYVSGDGSNWGNAVATGTFANNATEKEVTFQPAVGRYIRLKSVREVNGNPWTSMAEISVLGTTPSGNQPPDGVINSPSASMTINVGDLVQFSGTVSDPDGNLPLSYLWQFGQGSGVSPSTFEDPGQLQFNIPGTFAVTFTVTDGLGLADPTPATRTIIVRSQSPIIPKGNWTLLYVDSEELVGENGAATNAFDGNPNTIWHTAWLASNPAQPHEIRIDLGHAYAVNGFRYLPRQDGGANGRIGQYEFYVSGDGSNWGNAVASGTFANNATEKEVTFQSAVGRYIRLRSLREVNGNPWTSMAEISVLGTTPSGNQPPDCVINSPSESMTINIGDQVQFSGTGSDYDNNLPLTYLWQFGQGSGVSPSTFEDPGQLQFNIPGTFAVTFTVTDALGLPDPTPATRTITVRGGYSEESLPDWTGYNHGPFHPTDPTFITNPVLTAADVTDISAAFVADPFLFYESGTWYMFFEAYNSATRHGDIALALSSDGLHWRYDRIVLSEGFHHSFPLVFKHNGRYYMVPESFVQQQVRLYESTNFPYSWLHVATLASGRAFVDPAVFRHGNTWWMFAGDTTNSNCYLYYSDSLTNGWVEHPMSPVVRGDASKGRLGGRPFIYDNGRIVRIVQKNDSSGIAVRAFEVDKLTKTEYAEHEIPESPLLPGGNSGWNTQMHHFDPWWNGQYWICAVDGHHIGDDWSIGIYVSD